MTTTSKIKMNWAIPKWITYLAVVIIAVIIITIVLGAGNILEGLAMIAVLIFVTPLEWGVLNILNAMTVVLGIVIGTAIIAFLFTKRKYLRAQTVTVLNQPYTPQQQLATPQLYAGTPPVQQPVEVEEKKQ